MGWASEAIAALCAGETVTIHPRGKSMEPLVRSGQAVIVDPIDVSHSLNPTRGVKAGDIVLCRVHGKEYLHKVLAVDLGRSPARFMIGNNRGHQNGWTTAVFGRMRR